MPPHVPNGLVALQSGLRHTQRLCLALVPCYSVCVQHGNVNAFWKRCLLLAVISINLWPLAKWCTIMLHVYWIIQYCAVFLWIQWSLFQLLLPWQLAAAYGFGCTVLHSGREREGGKAVWRVGLGVIPGYLDIPTVLGFIFLVGGGAHLGHPASNSSYAFGLLTCYLSS